MIEMKPCPKVDWRGKPLPDAFWAKVAKAGPSECWEWRGARNVKGYGNFRSRSAHVVSFELTKGSVPVGLTIDHLCANRGCVNPAHLEAVTLAENIRRHAAKTTHCKRGHPLEGPGANVRIEHRPDGTRRTCRVCEALRARDALRQAKGGAL